MKKMTTIFLIISFAFALNIQPLFAGEIPKYQPTKYCKKLAAFGGSYSESTMSSCLDMEQQAYNNLKARWPTISTRIQKYCNKLAKFGGSGSYSTLESCIEMEQESQSKNNSRKFKF